MTDQPQMMDKKLIENAWWASISWSAVIILVVVVWWWLASRVLAEIAWIAPRIVVPAELDPFAEQRAWAAADVLQVVVTTIVMCIMVLVSVVVGGWFRRFSARVKAADGFGIVLPPLVSPALGGVMIAGAEPMRRAFTDWPAGYDAFPAYLVVWALTLGYMMKLPWDCATELLAKDGLYRRSVAFRASRRKTTEASATAEVTDADDAARAEDGNA